MRTTSQGATTVGVAVYFAVVIVVTVGGIVLIDDGLRSMSGILVFAGILLAALGCYAFSLPIRAIRRGQDRERME
jgi:uncharacterized membrane protein YidH (DUF202 family)